jgi:uncharacterized protein
MIERKILKAFRSWLQKEKRKPLILRGARQVGKTTVVNQFGEDFKQFIYLNLELKPDREVFEQDLAFEKLLQAIFFIKGGNPSEESTLIFIDEIQNSARAVQYLRYFYENAPEVPVICAGSLLEVFLEKFDISFPVGRVEYLYLYPVDFEEYLNCLDNTAILNAYRTIPMPDYAHSALLERFHEYCLVGGMPEICAEFLGNRDIGGLDGLYEALLTSYVDDAAKYVSGSSMFQTMRHAIESAPGETGKRIRFHGFGNSSYRSREMGEALRTLERAMLLYLIYPVTGQALPCLPDRKRSPRLQFIDTGLMNYHAGVQSQYVGVADLSGHYSGRLTEQVVGQEILAGNYLHNRKPMFWVREKSGSSSEVDFVIPHRSELIPVEVKSGKVGTLRSLHVFMDEVQHGTAVRLYAGGIQGHDVETSAGKTYTLLNLPYFLASKIDDYLDGM